MGEPVAVRTGTIDGDRAVALVKLLGSEVPTEAGDPVPPMWHWIYALDSWRPSELGVDGHPLRGLPSPPASGQRRMFAGGTTTHHRALCFGGTVTRTTRVLRTEQKHGRSGDLTFVTVRNEYAQAGRTVIVEDQDIVYRPAAGPGEQRQTSPEPEPPGEGTRFRVDTVTLFQFSALTANAHRIHYDRPYAATEGHPDVVVHGPLQVLLMAESLRRAGIPLTTFTYRLVAPARGPQDLHVVLVTSAESEDAVRVHDGTGVLVARGRLR
jgi:3-methylfumaryl-CoA hydratase